VLLLKATRRPRMLAGAHSQIYTGTTLLAIPTPSPNTSRPKSIKYKTYGPSAVQNMRAPKRNSQFEMLIALLRPYTAERCEDRMLPIKHPGRMAMDTIRPFSKFVNFYWGT